MCQRCVETGRGGVSPLGCSSSPQVPRLVAAPRRGAVGRAGGRQRAGGRAAGAEPRLSTVFLSQVLQIDRRTDDPPAGEPLDPSAGIP